MTAIIDREGTPIESIDPTVPEVVMESGEIVDATTVPWYFNDGEERTRQILAFIAARPRYTDQHVFEMANHLWRNSIPFCDECCDWHEADEQHSMSEAELYDPHEGPLP